jgi:hypothetical protein
VRSVIYYKLDYANSYLVISPPWHTTTRGGPAESNNIYQCLRPRSCSRDEVIADDSDVHREEEVESRRSYCHSHSRRPSRHVTAISLS